MDNNVTLTISRTDVTQILDALSQRLETWKNTRVFLQKGYADENYCIEECSDAEEANRIADRYSKIIRLIEQQSYNFK